MTPPRAGLRLSTLIWGVAFLALTMSAVLSPATDSGVVGVTVLGFVLTGLAVAIDAISGREARRPEDVAFLTSVLAAFAAVEVFGLVVAQGENESRQAIWFAAALGFAASGILASWRGGGSDGSVAAQLFFHGVMVVPAIAPIGKLAVRSFGSPEAISAFGVAGPVAKLLLVIDGIAMPPLFAGLLFALAHDLSTRDETRSPIWPSLLIHQAAYVVIALRWSYDGL